MVEHDYRGDKELYGKLDVLRRHEAKHDPLNVPSRAEMVRRLIDRAIDCLEKAERRK